MYNTYRSPEIQIGNLVLGGDQPVRIQSMANTDTNDIEASVAQCKRMIFAGAELVRLTTQGSREADSLVQVKIRLRKEGIATPVVADVHFNPAVAEKAAALVEKVRINPGNYTEKRTADNAEYNEETYKAGLELVKQKIYPLLEICKKNNTTLRIGVNHGSLSPRVMLKYGDTPLGMAESAMEFVRICHEAGFNRLVVSMKSSNTRVMVQSVRLLAAKLMEENLRVPLHLGVTEAGDGDEGRIRSAVGITPLLVEGFGDTIRVSLTEAPEKELPVAAALRDFFPKPVDLPYDPLKKEAWDPFSYAPPFRKEYKGIGGGKIPVVITGGEPGKNGADLTALHEKNGIIITGNLPSGENFKEPLFSFDEREHHPEARVVEISTAVPPSFLDKLENKPSLLILTHSGERPCSTRFWLRQYYTAGNTAPVIFRYSGYFTGHDSWLLRTAGVCGSLLIDGLIDGLWIDQEEVDPALQAETAMNILQASRSRFSKTEYIACPSCGRTLFDIETTLKKIRKATGHLPGLKLAVMGCIVNGPGEMADADYGYVGAGKGLVTLYKGKEPVKKGVPEADAVDELLALIKLHGDWKEPILSPGKK